MPILSCTFRELSFVKLFVERWQSVAPSEIIIISNSNPGDATSTYLQTKKNVVEIPCLVSDYWGGAIRRALEYTENHNLAKKNLIITNIDVLPNEQFEYGDYFEAMGPMQALSFSTVSNGKMYYSGVKKSRLLPIFSNKITPQGNKHEIVDYCPARFLCIKNETQLSLSKLVDSCSLPHYGCDFVFTYRLSLNGFDLSCTSCKVLEYNSENTGAKDNISNYPLTYLLTNIKSAHNIKYKFIALKLLDNNFIISLLYLVIFYVAFIAKWTVYVSKDKLATFDNR